MASSTRGLKFTIRIQTSAINQDDWSTFNFSGLDKRQHLVTVVKCSVVAYERFGRLSQFAVSVICVSPCVLSLSRLRPAAGSKSPPGVKALPSIKSSMVHQISPVSAFVAA